MLIQQWQHLGRRIPLRADLSVSQRLSNNKLESCRTMPVTPAGSVRVALDRAEASLRPVTASASRAS
eukprot:3205790-Rhodomonas_salina.1